MKKLTHSKGVDVIYDPVGGDFTEQALRAMAWNGRHLIIGFAAGEIPHFRANLILLKSCQVVGVDWGGSERREPGGNDRLLAELAEMIDRGELAPRAPAAFPLEQAGQVLTDLTERRLAGKAVLIPG